MSRTQEELRALAARNRDQQLEWDIALIRAADERLRRGQRIPASDDAARLASERPIRASPMPPAGLLKMLERGESPSDADVLDALYGLELTTDDPAIEYLAARVAGWAPRGASYGRGRPRLNDTVRVSRFIIGARVYRWRRVLVRYGLKGGDGAPPPHPRLRVWGITGPMQPMNAAMKVVAGETGFDERTIEECRREALANTPKGTDPGRHYRTHYPLS